MARKLSRRSIARHVATHLADGKSPAAITTQLAAYLIATHRTKELAMIVRDIEFYVADRGYVAGVVTSAHELGAATRAALEAFARQKTGASEVTLTHVLDESLLGGVKLELPGYEFDTTIARQLSTLKTRYKKA